MVPSVPTMPLMPVVAWKQFSPGGRRVAAAWAWPMSAQANRMAVARTAMQFVHLFGVDFWIGIGISVICGAYRGLQRHFGRSVIRGYLDWRREHAAWLHFQASDPQWNEGTIGARCAAWRRFTGQWAAAEAARARSADGTRPGPGRRWRTVPDAPHSS